MKHIDRAHRGMAIAMRDQAVDFSKAFPLEKSTAWKNSDLCLSYPAAFEVIANPEGQDFFNAGSVIATDRIAGIHFTAETDRKLGAAVAAQVELLLQ